MSNQKAPARPWFSFASLTRLIPTAPEPAPTPAPQPQPSLSRPTVRPPVQLQEPTRPAPARNAVVPQVSQPAPPRAPAPAQVPQEPARTTPSASRVAYFPSTPTLGNNFPPAASPNSLEKKPQPYNNVSAPASSITTSNITARKGVSLPARAPPSNNITTTAVMARAVTPTSSQEVIKAPANSSLPQPPKIPAVPEEKYVISQRTLDKPKAYNNTETYKPRNVFHEKQEPPKAKDNFLQQPGFEDDDHHGMGAVTISGENKGATMELHPSRKQDFRGNSVFRNNITSDERSETESSNDGSNNKQSNSKKKDKKSNKMRSLHPMRAFLNSNVQGINNSIVYNSSYNHHDPGIHLGLTKKPSEGRFYIKGSSKS